MFNLVPFARAWGEMADFHDHARAIGESLEFGLPEAVPMTVAPTAVAGNQQALGRAVSLAAHPSPPLGDRSDRELGRVVVDTHRNPGV